MKKAKWVKALRRDVWNVSSWDIVLGIFRFCRKELMGLCTRTIFGLMLVFTVAGCGKQIKDFVQSGGGREPGGSSPPPVHPSAPQGHMFARMSPGANALAVGTQVQSKFAITNRQRTLTGSQVSATFELHQTNPQ